MDNASSDKWKVILEIPQGHERELMRDQDILNPKMLMYPAYDAALRALGGIIKSTDDWYKHQEDGCQSPDMKLYGFANNVMAFCGNRGQGKTSTMLSFTSALGYPCKRKMIKGWNDEKEKRLSKYTLDRHFFVMPPIDPTMLREEETAIRLFLSNLLKEVRARWASKDVNNIQAPAGKPREAVKYDILERFQNCITGLHLEESRHETQFDAFAKSDDVFNVKSNIHEIVRHLFALLGWDQSKSFLIVQMDDNDMHMDYAYETLEHIRKYLCIPNVIVVMATDINQLRSLVNRHYREKLKCSADVGFNFDYIAAKYIDKLIPVPHTFHLPTLKSQYDLGKKLTLRIKKENGDIEEKGGIEEALFKLIYEKTGLVFIRHELYLHEIIPSSLRGYMHLYRLLDSMETPCEAKIDDLAAKSATAEEREERIAQRLRNLSVFEGYFTNEWIPSRIQEEKRRRKLLDLVNVSPQQLLKYIIKNLLPSEEVAKGNGEPLKLLGRWMGTDKHLNITRVKDEIKKSDGALSEPELYAAYLDALNWYESKYCLTADDFNYAFAIGTFVSIQMHKCSMVDEVNSGNQEDVGTKGIDFKRLKAVYDDSENENAGRKQVNNAVKFVGDINVSYFALDCLKLLKGTELKNLLNKEQDLRHYQLGLIYLACNWDVLHQIFDNVKDRKTLNRFSDAIFEHLNSDEKKAVGVPQHMKGHLEKFFLNPMVGEDESAAAEETQQ